MKAIYSCLAAGGSTVKVEASVDDTIAQIKAKAEKQHRTQILDVTGEQCVSRLAPKDLKNADED